MDSEPTYEVNETLLRAFLDAFPDSALMVEENGLIREVFSRDQGAIGQRAQSLRGRHVGDVWEDEKAWGFMNLIRDALKTGRTQTVEYWEHVEGKEYCFEARISPVETPEGHPRIVQWIAFEITERKRLETALHERDTLLEGLAKARTLLLSVKDYNEALRRSLSIIGRAAQVDRTYLYEFEKNNPEERIFTKRFEWLSPLAASFPTRRDFKYIDFHKWFEGWFDRLEQNGVIRARCSQQKDQTRRLMRWQRAESMLILPIFIDLELWGFIGFDDCQHDRVWEYSEVTTLRVAAGGIGSFIHNKQGEEMLRQAKEDADRANAAKSEFLAMMSHEIRTPMNSILGFADILERSDLPEESKEYATIINRSGKTLLELINNILDFSKIESRGVELTMEQFSLEMSIMEVLELLLVKAKEKGIALDFNITGDCPDFFLGDAARLRQILLNLASNAVKFTDQGSVTVNAHCERVPESLKLYNVTFEVIDTGIGIPLDRQKELFQPFAQVTAKDSARKYGGTGLGLVICKRLVNKMGGEISVHSEMGQGATFRFNILLENPSMQYDEVNRHEDDPSLSTDFAEHYPLNLLLAEDNVSNRELALNMLKSLGYSVTYATDGNETVEQLKTKNFDAVLLDIQLPHLDGLEITKMLREGKLGAMRKNLYLIAVSASAMADDRKRFLEAGINDSIAKPISSMRLKEALTQAHASIRCE